ncbi:OTU-domain-containing protein [Colletotrichum eremochloae]|uniref:Putative OTU-like cysteine protease n=1 Tax=Colletotrichum sublineola TaxID=1173701 RepID=A0A066XPE2_COLSU|nr:OTU-domain-containing protein [Colletotrichum sublineola]KAK2012580.1 OTU-domain-containing protein [Colletotrichum eremochloae]KDN67865.1 putative OTU-like cysteine protease [Colletotrichum sublineola]
MEAETLEQLQARHRKEQRDLVGRITSKKKNATKKTRKGINEECAEMERRLKERQEEELAALIGGGTVVDEDAGEEVEDATTQDDAAAAEVADRFKETSLSEPAPTTPSAKDEPQTPGQGQGKKRNRQKERMARRAAELEAAAVKAEEEARNMTDHRGAEKTYMLKEFKTHSLTEKEIAPDGHCLFSAVADQLAQKGIPLGGSADAAQQQEPYKVVRWAAAEWMARHPDDFAPFLEEDLETYARKIRDTAEWGGQLELAALANVYGVEIRVVQDGRTERIGPSAGDDADGAASEEPGAGKKEIWLAYYRHGYGLGEHYNSLRKTA